jgi:hypothetical protein
MTARSCPANAAGHTLYRWSSHGEEWACAAYDHGPFCRLCQAVADPQTRALLDAVERGRLAVHAASNGALVFEVRDA